MIRVIRVIPETLDLKGPLVMTELLAQLGQLAPQDHKVPRA